MIKLRILFLPVFLLFLLCGCIQTLNNIPVSQNADCLPARTGCADSNECIEKANPKEQKPSPVDNLAAENTIEAQTSIHNKKDKNKIAKNSLPEKKIQSIFDEALDFCEASQDFWQKGELENALEALDHAYSLILKIDTDDTAELIQQKEDLRYLISKRILEIYASRNIVVNGNHNAIPMVMNKHIQNEIDLFTKKGERRFFVEAYKRSGKYRPQIVSTLKKAGLPVELSWLPLIESGFKVNALSKARALGLWQFIPSTGYKFGL
ncbi:MAG: transglycosylase SLT domain-containing protein, partial [Desulfobacterales bacterium]